MASAAVVVILAAAGLLGWRALDGLSSEIESHVGRAAELDRLMTTFTSAISTELRAGEKYMLRPDPATRATIEQARREAHETHALLVRRHLARHSSDESDAALVARIDGALSRLEVTLAHAHRLRDLDDPRALEVLSGSAALERALRDDMGRLAARQDADILRLGTTMRERAAARAALLAGVLGAAAMLVLLLNWQVARSLTRPLGTLVERANALRRGGAAEHVDVSRMPGEYQILGAAMNRAGESMTALAAAQAALHRAEKLAAIGTLISGVAHELNNPLQTILLTTENLDEPHLDAEARADIHTIREQVQRASAIIRDLLASVRSEGSARPVVDLKALLATVERELAELAARSGSGLVMRIDPQLPSVSVDPIGMAQVLTNLVRNGAHAAGAGGTVWVEARASFSGCEVVVEDSGPGIGEAILPRVFEPLFTTKAEGQGTGLGLPVSRGIMERMGGDLVAEGRGAGIRTGARFSALLPLDPHRLAEQSAAPIPVFADEPPAPVPTMAPAAGLAPEPRRARILIVDDEPAIRRSLQRFFERRAWIVDVAGDGLEALAVLDANDEDAFAVILSDMRMPKMNGIELHDSLQARGSPAVRQLIVLSGDLVSAEVAAFLARVTCPILSKPVDLAELLRTADAIAARHAAAADSRELVTHAS